MQMSVLLKGLKTDYDLLPYWYDVDTIKDLRFLEIHLAALGKEICRETRKVFCNGASLSEQNQN